MPRSPGLFSEREVVPRMIMNQPPFQGWTGPKPLAASGKAGADSDRKSTVCNNVSAYDRASSGQTDTTQASQHCSSASRRDRRAIQTGGSHQ